MICNKCGSNNPENSKFCQNCGNTLLHAQEQPNAQNAAPKRELSTGDLKSERSGSEQSSSADGTATGHEQTFNEAWDELKTTVVDAMNTPAQEYNDTICPFCHEGSCQPVQKSTTEVNSHGYRWGTGCCAMLLLGPFGLLCGLCGTGTDVKTTNELWWTCMKCGKQHLSLKDALEKWETAVSAVLGTGVSGGIAFWVLKWLGFGFFSVVAAAIPAGTLYTVLNDLTKATGISFDTCLTPEQKKECVRNLVIATVLVLAIGVLGERILLNL